MGEGRGGACTLVVVSRRRLGGGAAVLTRARVDMTRKEQRSDHGYVYNGLCVLLSSKESYKHGFRSDWIHCCVFEAPATVELIGEYVEGQAVFPDTIGDFAVPIAKISREDNGFWILKVQGHATAAAP